MATRSQVEAHRRDLRALTGLAGNDLTLLWRRILSADATVTRDGLINALPRLVTMYGAAAATLGADFYDDLRDDAGVKKRFTAIPAELPDVGRTDALARWAVTPLFAAEPQPDVALSKAAGGLQRIIANADRHTVLGSVKADPSGKGWARETAGGCDFCQMLASRGGVYTAESADFDTHDNCHCIAAPVFG